MTSLTDVWVTVKPDMDKFGPEVKKKLNSIDSKKEGAGLATRFGYGFNGAFGGIMSKSAGLFVGAFAAVKGAQVFGGFINDARESAKVARVSAAVIKSTGGIAGITATQMGDLATAISNKTGADDEAIQSGENLLATFTNVRNGLGKGNDIFNRATQAAVDMASAMNNGVVDANGLKSANIQLGKALNDPIKGVTALSKVGVSFTAQQKAQIKTLTTSGDLLGAQKIILGEVGKEFGGAAAAAADPLSRLQTIAGNLAEKVGGFLLPTVDKFATFVGDKAIPKISAFSDVFSAKVTPKLKEFGGFIQAEVLPRLLELGGFIREKVLPRLLEFGGFFKEEIIPKLKEFAGFLVDNIVPAVKNLVTAFTPLAKDIGKAAVGIFEKLAPVVVSIGTAIVSNVIPAIKDFTKFLSDNKTLVGAVAVGVGAMVVAFYAYQAALGVVTVATTVYAAVQKGLNLVMSLNPIGVVVLALVGLAAGLTYAYQKSAAFRAVVDGAFKAVVAAGKFMWDLFLKPMFANFVTVLQGVWGAAQNFARTVSASWGAIKEPARIAIKFVVDKFLGMVGTLLEGASKAFGWVPGLGDKLKGAATEFQKFRTNVNNALDGINDEDINVGIKYSSTGVNLTAPSSVGRKATGGPGGPVDGPGTTTSDTAGIYALSRKEWVIKAKSSMKYGDYAMRSVNDGTATVIPNGGFAAGGRPGLNVRNSMPSASRYAEEVASLAMRLAKPYIDRGAKQVGTSPGLNGVLSFIKSQVGKPYLWGGVGPGGYDCSGLVSAAINVALGRNPHQRLGATGSMPWSMFASGPGAFQVGWFKGNPGHTAATVNGVNIESAGGVGVRMGSGARGANSSLFTNRAHVKGFAGGGPIGDAPYDSLKGRKGLLKELGIDTFDTGGKWRSGTLGANLSGKTETVRTEAQEAALGRDTNLSQRTIDAQAAANKKAFKDAMNEAKFRLVGGSGGAYTLQMTNG